jgi:hypothetical protein
MMHQTMPGRDFPPDDLDAFIGQSCVTDLITNNTGGQPCADDSSNEQIQCTASCYISGYELQQKGSVVLLLLLCMNVFVLAPS